MRAAARVLWIAPFAALAGAALAQTTSAPIGGAATGSTPITSPAPGQIRGLGLPAVPNNSLPPITTPSTTTTTTPGEDIVTRPSTVTTPSTGFSSGTTPITGSITPGITTTTTPGVAGSATLDAFISLPPPVVNAPLGPAPVRTCPSGMAFC